MQDLHEKCMSEASTKVAMGRWMSGLLSYDTIMNELCLSEVTKAYHSPNLSHKRSYPSSQFCNTAKHSSPSSISKSNKL